MKKKTHTKKQLINSNNTVLCIILVLLSNWDTSSYNTKNKLKANEQEMNVETQSTLALSNRWRFLLTETWQELPLLAQVPVQLCHLLPVFVL